MFTKGSRFYADWRDKRGTRRRRAFTTAEEATTYEAEQTQRTHPKPKGPALKSPRSSGPISKRGKQSVAVKTAAPKPCNKSAKPSSPKRATKQHRT